MFHSTKFATLVHYIKVQIHTHRKSSQHLEQIFPTSRLVDKHRLDDQVYSFVDTFSSILSGGT